MLAGIKHALGAAMMTTLMSAGFVSGECDLYVVEETTTQTVTPHYDPCPCNNAVVWYNIGYPVSEVNNAHSTTMA